ncbi:MAG TPA: GNAT family N-acetyltransferase [Symbiobacteriaceae bacterium]|nr:GNAT family N-acetyltransferase [Symbiobacteriaceae bacterium]
MPIRSPAERNIAEVVAISQACYPERPEDPRHWAAADPTRYFVAIEHDGSVTGYGAIRPDLPRFPDLPKYRLHLGVRPDRRGQGIGPRKPVRLHTPGRTVTAASLRPRMR